MKTILILEDNDERIAGFQKAVAELGDGFDLKIWRDAPSMIAECAEFFGTAALICLDHDLNPQPGAVSDPGTGLDVTQFLSDFLPVWTVLARLEPTGLRRRGGGGFVSCCLNRKTPGAQATQSITENVWSECDCHSTALGWEIHWAKCSVINRSMQHLGSPKTTSQPACGDIPMTPRWRFPFLRCLNRMVN